MLSHQFDLEEKPAGNYLLFLQVAESFAFDPQRDRQLVLSFDTQDPVRQHENRQDVARHRSYR